MLTVQLRMLADVNLTYISRDLCVWCKSCANQIDLTHTQNSVVLEHDKLDCDPYCYRRKVKEGVHL